MASRVKTVGARSGLDGFGELGSRFGGQVAVGRDWSGAVRSVKLRRSRWARRCVLGFDGLRFGHGEAVLIRCVRVRFDRVRTRCGGHVKVRYVVFR